MMDEETIYIPKGGMCKVCEHSKADCSYLPFDRMTILDVCNVTLPSIITVRCHTFKKLLHVQEKD